MRYELKNIVASVYKRLGLPWFSEARAACQVRTAKSNSGTLVTNPWLVSRVPVSLALIEMHASNYSCLEQMP
jgi:hypothetical protein